MKTPPSKKRETPANTWDDSGLIRKRDVLIRFISVSRATFDRWVDAEHLNDPGNMLCLRADVAAQFMHAEFAWLDSVEGKILGFRAEKEGGSEAMRAICAQLAGKPITITWSERHFIRLCALWSAA